MHSYSRGLVKSLLWIEVGVVAVVVFHLGGSFAHLVGQFAPLGGAFVGASLTLLSAASPRTRREKTEAWLGNEQVSWLLIGCGILAWGLGESFWQYYTSIKQSPFPSIADAGYSLLPLFIFAGLLLQPPPTRRGRRRVLLLDSLISMGSIFAIAWYLLLGVLAQAPGEANLAKFLGIYYPTADTALLSCIIFLLLRGQGRAYQVTARRTALLVAALGILFFVFSDFLFNVQNNAGTYVAGTWVDMGWPLGMVTIGIAAYMRRFLPATPEEEIEERVNEHGEQGEQNESIGINLPQFVPYALLAMLFLALTLNVLSIGADQLAIRPVLVLSTLLVVALVIARQLLTLWENTQLAQRQAEALYALAQAKQHIEQQALHIANYNTELELGIEHLKGVHSSIANGNMRARAHLTNGALLPLAGSLNLMAERLMKLGQHMVYAQRLSQSLADLGLAFERTALGHPLLIPESCGELPEVQRLLVAMRVKRITGPASSSSSASPLASHVSSGPLASMSHAGLSGNSVHGVNSANGANGNNVSNISNIGQVRQMRPASQSANPSSPFPSLPDTPPSPHPVTQAMTIPRAAQQEMERPQRSTDGQGQGQRREGTMRPDVLGMRPSPPWDGTM